MIRRVSVPMGVRLRLPGRIGRGPRLGLDAAVDIGDGAGDVCLPLQADEAIGPQECRLQHGRLIRRRQTDRGDEVFHDALGGVDLALELAAPAGIGEGAGDVEDAGHRVQVVEVQLAGTELIQVHVRENHQVPALCGSHQLGRLAAVEGSHGLRLKYAISG